MKLIGFIIIISSILTLPSCSHLNGCLRLHGCHRDECCLVIIPKTGPSCVQKTYCSYNFKLDCCDNSLPVRTNYGTFYGYQILLDEFTGYHEKGDRYLEIWQGIPYARPASRENNARFRKALPLDYSNQRFDATKLAPACPYLISDENLWSRTHGWNSKLFPEFTSNDSTKNSSEDCLYLNIYSLKDKRRYSTSLNSLKKVPILVIFITNNYLMTNANFYPGHILAQLGIMVITVNYRSGPFGFTSRAEKVDDFSLPFLNKDDTFTENLGLWDQLEAIKFIKKIALYFNGNPDEITLLGQGTAATHLSYHLFSKLSLNQPSPIAKRLILIDPKMEWSDYDFVSKDRYRENFRFTRKMGELLGCEHLNSIHLIDCLKSRRHEEISQAADEVLTLKPEQTFNSKPWKVVIDNVFLQESPYNLYRTNDYSKIPVYAMMSQEAGVFEALSSLIQSSNMSWKKIENPLVILKDLNESLDETLCFRVFENMARSDSSHDSQQVASIIMREYNLKSNENLLQDYIKAFTDKYFSTGLFRFLEMISTCPLTLDECQNFINQTHLLILAYHSRKNELGPIIHTYYGSVLNNILGLYYLIQSPFVNWQDHLNLKRPSITLEEYVDRNVTDYFLWMIQNIVVNGNATPTPIRNMTWDTFRPDNRTYFYFNLDRNYSQSYSFQRYYSNHTQLGHGFDLRNSYRTVYFNFWQNIYDKLLLLEPRRPFHVPKPEFIDYYRLTCFILGGLILILILFSCIICLSIYKGKNISY